MNVPLSLVNVPLSFDATLAAPPLGAGYCPQLSISLIPNPQPLTFNP
jgi:hypothetical protein